MNNKHKPCPFCGSKNLVISYGNLYVECIDCGCYGPAPKELQYDTQLEIKHAIVWELWDERNEQRA